MKQIHLILTGWTLLGCLLVATDAPHLWANRQPGQNLPESSLWTVSDAAPNLSEARPIAQENSADVSKASLAEFAWLEGKWQGNWGPRIAEQIWLDPRAGEMPGLFRVVENDKTLVLELYSLIETPNGLELRLRHFTPSLAPWEQSAITILRLTSLVGGAIFENASGGQPGKQTLIRVDADTYVSRTEITSDSENKQVTEIRFQRVKAPVEEAPPSKKKPGKSH
jgi:hypothetical protein